MISNNTAVTREAVINDNIGLVHACANRFRGKGIEYDDLFQAGCIGLVKATDAFDANRGVAFSTYAVPVILGEIKRLFRDGGSIKVSRALKELSLRASREIEKFSVANGREPTLFELAALIDSSPEKTAQAISAGKLPLSLTADEDEDNTVRVDVITDFPENEICDRILLKNALSVLDSQDRNLIVLRYFKNKTQSETAVILGMTQVQVSRREKKILIELRNNMT